MKLDTFERLEIFLAMFFSLILFILFWWSLGSLPKDGAIGPTYSYLELGSCEEIDTLSRSDDCGSSVQFSKKKPSGKLISFFDEDFVTTASFRSLFPEGKQPYQDIAGGINGYSMLEKAVVDFARKKPGNIEVNGSNHRLVEPILQGSVQVFSKSSDDYLTSAKLCCCDSGDLDKKVSVRSNDNREIFSFHASSDFIGKHCRR